MPDAKGSSVPSAGRGRGEPDNPPPPVSGTSNGPSSAPPPPPGGADWSDPGGFLKPGVVNVKLVYSAYLVAIAIPIAALFGAYFAYQAQRKGPPAWLMTHYVYQMRTFWIGLGANIVAWILMFAGVGLILFPLIAVWVVARAVHGLIRVAQRQPVDTPNSLLI